jgi:signal transduction histidine kinase
LLLTVEDAGPGFDLKEARAKGNVGLIGMQERARLIGGAMLLTTSPGKGVRIDVRAPLRGAA